MTCTLEEFFFGCQKEIQFDRIERVDHRGTERVVTIARLIEILPGMGATPSDTLRFLGEGHQRFAQPAGDLIIKFAQAAHPRFRRENGDDLVYYHKVSLLDALRSQPVKFVTIEGETVEVALDEVITQRSEKVIEGKGMPQRNEDPLGPIKRAYQRGRLVVRFDIQFPERLSEERRKEINAVLDESMN